MSFLCIGAMLGKFTKMKTLELSLLDYKHLIVVEVHPRRVTLIKPPKYILE